jgi:ABC-type glycerol-3-phosphate transport system permease component
MINRIKSLLMLGVQYLLLVVMLIFLLFPIYWMLITSLKGPGEVQMLPQSYWPRKITLENYPHMFDAWDAGRSFLNSVTIAGFAALGGTILGGAAAFGFNRFEFPGKALLLGLLVVSVSLPGLTTVGPVFMAYRALDIYDTKTGLILVNLSFAVSFGVYFLFAYFQTIPKDLDDAAAVDGCTWLATLWHVIFPIAMPGMVTTFLIEFIAVWNDFVFVNTLTASSSTKTLIVRLTELPIPQSLFVPPYHLIAVGGIMCLVPVAMIALIGQRRIVEGIVAGAIKG